MVVEVEVEVVVVVVMVVGVGLVPSHVGFIFLQWPHQGAKNFRNTVLPAVAPS